MGGSDAPSTTLARGPPPPFRLRSTGRGECAARLAVGAERDEGAVVVPHAAARVRPRRVEDQEGEGGTDQTLHRALRAQASRRRMTIVALVPPKPNELDSTVAILASSRRSRTMGMSAKSGSSSSMLALAQMKPLFIISSE